MRDASSEWGGRCREVMEGRQEGRVGGWSLERGVGGKARVKACTAFTTGVGRWVQISVSLWSNKAPNTVGCRPA